MNGASTELTVPETRPSAVAALVPVAFEEWRRRPRLEKTREYFWSYFGEIF